MNEDAEIEEEDTPEVTLRRVLSEKWLEVIRAKFDPDSKALDDIKKVEERKTVQNIYESYSNVLKANWSGKDNVLNLEDTVAWPSLS